MTNEALKEKKVKVIDNLIKEYKANPNCYPELWISGENVTSEEKLYFINQTI